MVVVYGEACQLLIFALRIALLRFRQLKRWVFCLWQNIFFATVINLAWPIKIFLETANQAQPSTGLPGYSKFLSRCTLTLSTKSRCCSVRRNSGNNFHYQCMLEREASFVLSSTTCTRDRGPPKFRTTHLIEHFVLRITFVSFWDRFSSTSLGKVEVESFWLRKLSQNYLSGLSQP